MAAGRTNRAWGPPRPTPACRSRGRLLAPFGSLVRASRQGPRRILFANTLISLLPSTLRLATGISPGLRSGLSCYFRYPTLGTRAGMGHHAPSLQVFSWAISGFTRLWFLNRVPMLLYKAKGLSVQAIGVVLVAHLQDGKARKRAHGSHRCGVGRIARGPRRRVSRREPRPG